MIVWLYNKHEYFKAATNLGYKKCNDKVCLGALYITDFNISSSLIFTTAHWQVANYPEANGHFTCSGIMFNHEYSVRSEALLSHKIICADTHAQSKAGLQTHTRIHDEVWMMIATELESSED